MNVLVITASNPHGHDYLEAYIYDGLKAVIEEAGLGQVWDAPHAPWLHLPPSSAAPSETRLPDPGARDGCNLDCDAAFPGSGLSIEEAQSRVRDAAVDLVVGRVGALPEVVQVVQDNPKDVPIAIVNGSDEIRCRRAEAAAALGPWLVAYFEREVPWTPARWWRKEKDRRFVEKNDTPLALGDYAWQGVTPLPMCYPARRVPHGLDFETKRGCFYSSVSQEGTAASRMQIAGDLQRQCGAEASLLPPNPTGRPAPEEYHEKLARALVGVHWAPPHEGVAHGWDANRFWENAAHGLVTVSQRPFTRQIRPFVGGCDVVWVDAPGEVAPAVARLLAEPERARLMAKAVHAWYLKHHTSEARARYLLSHAGLEAPAQRLRVCDSVL